MKTWIFSRTVHGYVKHKYDRLIFVIGQKMTTNRKLISGEVFQASGSHSSNSRDSQEYNQKQVWVDFYKVEKQKVWIGRGTTIIPSTPHTYLKTICVHSDATQIWVVDWLCQCSQQSGFRETQWGPSLHVISQLSATILDKNKSHLYHLKEITR